VFPLSSAGAPISQSPEARDGMAKGDPIVSKIKHDREKTGKYPASLEEIDLTAEERQDIERIGLRYKSWMNNSKFGIAFNIDRGIFKPWCSFDSTADTWRCLLK
jgi:hypothetical protein